MAPVQAVFADTNTLVRAFLRNILIELAPARTIDPRWSAQVLDELARTLHRLHQRSKADTTALFTAMNLTLPSALVIRQPGPPPSAVLPDPNDQGILVEARQRQCSILLTINLRHFPSNEVQKD